MDDKGEAQASPFFLTGQGGLQTPHSYGLEKIVLFIEE
jgi:hypothetical protein